MSSLLTSAFCILATGFFYVNEPVVDMRENPSKASKVVSQTSLSEEVSREKEQDGWSSIITSDGYTGWVPSDALVHLQKPYDASLKTSRLVAHVYGVKDTEYGPIAKLPFASPLQGLEINDARWIAIVLPDGREGFIQRGDIAVEPELSNKADLVQFSQKFLGLPYTWGGRSSFGYDCSGFVQMLYKQIGINLQRDAKQQILDNRLQSIAVNQLEPGDLLFFGKSEQKIMHVGMYIGDGQFIHATARENKPWIRKSSLSDMEWSGQQEVYYPYRTARRLLGGGPLHP